MMYNIVLVALLVTVFGLFVFLTIAAASAAGRYDTVVFFICFIWLIVLFCFVCTIIPWNWEALGPPF